MNPDEGRMLARVFQANRDTISTTRDLMQHCGVRRPEMLSMEMCLAGDRGLDEVKFENIDVRRWAQAKDDLRKRHVDVPPHCLRRQEGAKAGRVAGLTLCPASRIQLSWMFGECAAGSKRG